MPLRWQEVAIPLALILGLIVLKYVPAAAHLPLGRAAGIVAFAYAGFLALRLIQTEEPVAADGRWSELRASPVEWFGAAASAAFSAMLLAAIIINGSSMHVPYAQMALGMALSLGFALASGAITFLSILSRTRWDGLGIEHVNGFGRGRKLAWSEVTGVRSTWRGVTIAAADSKSISFSPFHQGAASLIRLARQRADRNQSLAAKAFETP